MQLYAARHADSGRRANMTTTENPAPLASAVAVVAGATRGAGRGIARALGEAGAIVYCTGRSTQGRRSPYNRPETIEETAEIINSAGGNAIAVRVDHAMESEVAALFERVEREQGRLDILVNSIAGEDPMMHGWSPFWDADLGSADTLLRQALLSRATTAKHAARLMIGRRRGLIVEVTENDLLLSSGGALTQVVRLAHKGLAAIYAAELRRQDVVAVAITPGFLRSERMLEHFGVSEDNWREAGKQDRNFLESESPLFVGRAIVALATDPQIGRRTGQLLSSWEVAREYGFTDIDGRRPDWGRLDVDYSQIPAPMLDTMRDEIDVHAAWIAVLAKRAEAYREAFLRQTAADRMAAEHPR
jgi:NAD(P)-dependent dehydrogenase (short-subunit alcohol dehydrogenase family)